VRGALWLALLVGCKGDSAVPIETDTDADTDSDTDTDTDADTDTDTDADADTDVLDCNPGAYTSPDPGQNGLAECVTELIECGQTIRGTNVGGSTSFGTNPGEAFFMCSGTSSGDDLSGPERVYKIVVGPNINALEVSLESCAPSKLLWHRSAQSCWDTPLNACDFAREGTPTSQYDALLVGSLGEVHFIVEGDQNDGGNFALTVDCFE